MMIDDDFDVILMVLSSDFCNAFIFTTLDFCSNIQYSDILMKNLLAVCLHCRSQQAIWICWICKDLGWSSENMPWIEWKDIGVGNSSCVWCDVSQCCWRWAVICFLSLCKKLAGRFCRRWFTAEKIQCRWKAFVLSCKSVLMLVADPYNTPVAYCIHSMRKRHTSN